MSAERPRGPQDITERQLPHDDSAEQAVIGSVLIDHRCLEDLSAIVRPAHFMNDDYETIYRHMLAIFESGKPIDPVTLFSSLKSAGQVDRMGGTEKAIELLAEAGRAVPHAGHAVYYGEIVAKNAAYRAIIAAATDAISAAYRQDMEPGQIVAGVETGMSHVSGNAAMHEVISIGEAASLALQDLDAHAGEPKGVYLGLEKIDRHFGVLMPGDLTVLAARPSCGKTTMATQIGMHLANRGRRFLLVSLEMRGVEIAGRVMCGLAKVNNRDFRRGTLSQYHREQLDDAAHYLQGTQCHIWAPQQATVQDIRATARLYHRKNPLSLIAVDYLSLIAAPPQDFRKDRRDKIGDITKALKRLARELQVPVLLLCQLNRDAEKERPRTSNLRESGAIEEDADQIFFLHRPEPNSSTVQFIIAKNRFGEGNGLTMELEFDGHRFETGDPKQEDLFE